MQIIPETESHIHILGPGGEREREEREEERVCAREREGGRKKYETTHLQRSKSLKTV